MKRRAKEPIQALNPTPVELSEELSILRVHMVSVSQLLTYFGGFDPEAMQHAAELRGAAKVVGQWSRRLKRRKVAKRR